MWFTSQTVKVLPVKFCDVTAVKKKQKKTKLMTQKMRRAKQRFVKSRVVLPEATCHGEHETKNQSYIFLFKKYWKAFIKIIYWTGSGALSPPFELMLIYLTQSYRHHRQSCSTKLSKFSNQSEQRIQKNAKPVRAREERKGFQAYCLKLWKRLRSEILVSLADISLERYGTLT